MENEIIYDLYLVHDCEMAEVGWELYEGGLSMESCVGWMRSECGYPAKRQSFGNTLFFFFEDRPGQTAVMLVPTNLD